MKIIKVIIIVLFSILALTFIFKNIAKSRVVEDPVQKDIENIENVLELFENQLDNLGINEETVQNVITQIEEYNRKTDYVVAFGIEKRTAPKFKITIHLPVDEVFFNKVEIGDIITKEDIEDFEELTQYIDDWIVTVDNKIIRANENK